MSGRPSPLETTSSPTVTTSIFRSPKVWIAIGLGGVALAGIIAVINHYRKSPRTKDTTTRTTTTSTTSFTSQSSTLRGRNQQYIDLARKLGIGQSLNGQKLALETLYEISRVPREHDPLRNNHVLDALLALLGTKPEDPELLYHLIRVLANLAINEENRRVMGSGGAVTHLLASFGSSEERITEHALRCLLNLSISTENEDVIREQGGLPKLFTVFQSDASPTILFQTTRVLINLVHNQTNRSQLLALGIVDRAIELLLTLDKSSSGGTVNLCVRLVVLLGFLSVDANPETYRKIANTVEFLVRLLQQHASREDDTGALDGIQSTLSAIQKIAKREGEETLGDRRQFQSKFAERSDAGKSGIETIAELYNWHLEALQKNAVNTLISLARDNETVKQLVIQQESLPSEVTSRIQAS